MSQLKKLVPFAEKPEFLKSFQAVKTAAKQQLAHILEKEHGFRIDSQSIFDVQIKRIHEYKRQLLNALHIIMLYNRVRQGRTDGLVPRTFLLAGKAAPGYMLAKLIIKLINNISMVVNQDPAAREYLRVYFIPNYRVSLAEKLFPAAEVSQQISTAGTEASGTGNMKFMCNGALTLGTLDGANIEIVEEVGRENAFIFGLTADEVSELRPNYNPVDFYNKDEEIKSRG